MSKFVSGGTVDKPVERSDEWLKAQQAVEAKIVEKHKLDQEQGGKSLFETLQANKAAKQEAFEESIRLKNQFRALDQDEVDFLDSINEATRAKENAIRKDTAEQLSSFRDQRQQAERQAAKVETAPEPVPSDTWAVTARKRRRDKTGPLTGVKIRKQSSSSETPPSLAEAVSSQDERTISSTAANAAAADPVTEDATAAAEKSTKTLTHGAPPNSTEATQSTPNLGLGEYSSDDDD